jgi:hypothetical protein
MSNFASNSSLQSKGALTMPTGYTAQIKDGITFKQFIMSCARAFGACVEMREEPADAPIPESFSTPSYHQERMDEAKKELALISNISIETAIIEANDAYNKELTRIKKAILESEELEVKYCHMLKQVHAWSPPSPEHVGLKDFMIEQIESSIKHDLMKDYYEKRLCEIKCSSGAQWKKTMIESKVRDIEYYAKEHEEEKSRVESRNSWIKALRKSLEAIK